MHKNSLQTWKFNFARSFECMFKEIHDTMQQLLRGNNLRNVRENKFVAWKVEPYSSFDEKYMHIT